MPIDDFLHPYAGLYLASPRWLKASAGRAYSMIPERVRLGPSYYAFRELLASTRHSPAASAATAREKLRETLSWALETVPAYQRCRGLDSHRTMDAEQLLAKLPITDKEDIKRAPERYVSRALPGSQRLRAVTGGTTCNPLEFCLHKNVTRAKEQAFIEEFRARVGARPGTLMLSLRERLVPGAGCSDDKPWVLEPIKGQLVFSPAHLTERSMPRLAEALLRLRPAHIEAFPSLLVPLARWLAAHPLPEFTQSVKGVMLYSETVQPGHLRLFREVFGCPVLGHYGHSERVLMAASMPDDDRYHFWPQYGWFELVDFEDRPIRKPGVLGHIVGTSFDNRVMPFVRYRTGDLAVLGASGHPELPGFPVCERIEGRVQEFVVDGDYRLVSLSTLGAAHCPWFAMVDALQYEQERPGELVLKYSGGERFSVDDQRRMAEAVARATGCRVQLVRARRIERTGRGKQRVLVQKLDLTRYFGAQGVSA